MAACEPGPLLSVLLRVVSDNLNVIGIVVVQSFGQKAIGFPFFVVLPPATTRRHITRVRRYSAHGPNCMLHETTQARGLNPKTKTCTMVRTARLVRS